MAILGNVWAAKRLTETVSIRGAHRQSGADVLFSNGSSGDNLFFVRNGKYQGLFKNNNYRRQIHVNFFLKVCKHYYSRVAGSD